MSRKAPQGDDLPARFSRVGNVLTFDWPSKTPNHGFRLGDLIHALMRLSDFLSRKRLELSRYPMDEWAESTWTIDYWPQVQAELILIWSSLPEEPRKLYRDGVETAFENLEEYLCDVKFKCFESISHIPCCLMDEHLEKQLGWHVNILRMLADSDDQPSRDDLQKDLLNTNSDGEFIDDSPRYKELQPAIDANESAAASDPLCRELVLTPELNLSEGPNLIVRFLRPGTMGDRSCSPGEVWPVEKSRALALLLHSPPIVELATPDELRRDRDLIREIEFKRKRWNQLRGPHPEPLRLVVRFVRPGKNSHGDMCEPGEVWEVEEEHANGLLRGKSPIGELATEAEWLGYRAMIAKETMSSTNNKGGHGKKVRHPKGTKSSSMRDLIIGALSEHHQYSDGICLTLEPIGNNELARKLCVSTSVTSEFFKKEFGSHRKYKTDCVSSSSLILALRSLRGEIAPRQLRQGGSLSTVPSSKPVDDE